MKSKLNVLHIIATMDVGGAERQIVEFFRIIDRDKFNPMICCLTHGGLLLKEIEAEGIKSVVFHKQSKLDFSIIFKLARLMKQEKIDIVHTWMFTSNTFGRIAAKFARVPVVITTEVCMADLFKNILQRLVDKFLVGWSDIIIACSSGVRMSHITEERIPSGKIITINNGVNTQNFQPSVFSEERKKKVFALKNSIPVIGAVGRLVDKKGFEYFLEAAKEALKYRQLKFIIVGEGYLRSKLENLSAKLGISDSLIFMGYQENILEIFNLLDIFVVPSLSEGLSVTLLEGMAMAKPIVATNIAGNTEVMINRKTGILIPPENSQAMAKALIELLDNPEFACKVGQEARIHIEKEYSILNYKKKIENIYETFSRKKNKKIY